MVLIRASIGTLALLGLIDLKMIEEPRVAYLLQYSTMGCRANCMFCLQSRGSSGRRRIDYLGRVYWPPVELNQLRDNWRRVFNRICLQTVIKPGFTREALDILRELRSLDPDIPISLAITPVPVEVIREARSMGVDSLGIGLDTATSSLFEKWSKPYSWSTYWRFIEKAVDVFGEGNVYVHLVTGLGESLLEVVSVMKKIHSIGARIALFNYVDETGRTRVDLVYYRLVQLARYMIESGLDPDTYIDYSERKIRREIPLGDIYRAFYTSGCPDCNRPFYNENPSGPLYNIPSEKILHDYLEKLTGELISIGVGIEILHRQG